MPQFHQYVGRVNGIRGTFGGLPPWARTIIGIFAVPGLVLMVLSTLLFVVSILALFLLTVPVYSLLMRIIGRAAGTTGGMTIDGPFGSMFPSPVPTVKHVSATVIDPSLD